MERRIGVYHCLQIQTGTIEVAVAAVKVQVVVAVVVGSEEAEHVKVGVAYEDAVVAEDLVVARVEPIPDLLDRPVQS